MSTALMWFRQDLRCSDNPALAEACAQHSLIIPLYIAEQTPHAGIGGAQRWWLHHSLESLQTALQQHGLNLCLRKGEPAQVLAELVQQWGVTAVYWNRCYEPAHIKRDTLIKEKLKAIGITVSSYNGSLLNEPWTIKNKSGTHFKVFTPYWRHSAQQVSEPLISSITAWPKALECASECLTDWDLLPKKPDWAKGFSSYWEPGEIGAAKKLNLFIAHHLKGYKELRDVPSQDATSRLSPHLHFGEISPWRVWSAIQEAKQLPDCDLRSADHFLSELGWREFSYYLLYHFPALPKDNFRSEFDHFPWQSRDDLLQSWQKGLTGFPIVDAGMRELWHTGYMHNRVRMITASFLIKDLLIDWREGAKWFMNTLLDADLANNSASWQWVAGTGADSAPYYRIFNPTLQGEKFDPQGKYIKSWVPELAKVPTQWIHTPWEAPPQSLPITLGKHYPFPLVDHSIARKLALEHYQQLRHYSKT